MKKYFIVAIAIICAALIGGAVWFIFFRMPPQIACTQEAKLCPDGSYVGRTGPNCEFASCPESANNNPNWKTFSNNSLRVSFQYPDQFVAAAYIRDVDWPPQITVNEGPFTCTEGGSEIMQAGQIEKIMINGREYCLTKETQGAAGSTYTQYAYAFAKNNKVLIFTFSLRAVQCANYDDPQKTQCQTERDAFQLDNSIIDRMAQSVQLK